jgi:AcrR family transcriptional regulator
MVKKEIMARQTATADLLFSRARSRFGKGDRVSVEELADELGISRATAYRWVGNGEQLAGEVIARLAQDTFRRALSEARGRGAARVLSMMERGLRLIVAFEPYREFLARDPQKALRIVASKEGPVQARTIALHEELLVEEIRRGHLKLPVDPHTMAYALVRIAESFLYADVIAGEKPDIDKAVEILRLMLRS